MDKHTVYVILDRGGGFVETRGASGNEDDVRELVMSFCKTGRLIRIRNSKGEVVTDFWLGGKLMTIDDGDEDVIYLKDADEKLWWLRNSELVEYTVIGEYADADYLDTGAQIVIDEPTAAKLRAV